MRAVPIAVHKTSKDFFKTNFAVRHDYILFLNTTNKDFACMKKEEKKKVKKRKRKKKKKGKKKV